jgi:hypothetical protein
MEFLDVLHKTNSLQTPKSNPVENTVQFSSVDLCLEHFFISIVHMGKMTSAVAICKQAWIPTSS